MNFLIIGGLGYIGQVLQQELTAAGHEFNIVDNDLLGLHNWNNKLDILNYADFKSISELISKSDVVINLAAVVGDQACLVDTKLTINTNCQGIQHITNLCNRFNKKIIHSSTCSLYGSSEGLLTEKAPVFPVDFYGQTKYQQERYVLENADNYCILRLGTAYGWSPRMRFDLVANTFTAKAHNNEKLIVNGGEQWRPFVHIRDIARALIFAAENNLSGVYNLSNENITIKELAKMIVQNGTPIEFNELMSDPRNYRVDNSRILGKGFEFKWNLRKGIEDMNNHPDELKNYKDPRNSNYKMMILRNLK